jgi:hypothetical protein
MNNVQKRGICIEKKGVNFTEILILSSRNLEKKPSNECHREVPSRGFLYFPEVHLLSARERERQLSPAKFVVKDGISGRNRLSRP